MRNVTTARKVDTPFMTALTKGHLRHLLQRVKKDPDLELFVRRNYINVYFKGASILKLTERGGDRYAAETHRQYLKQLPETPDVLVLPASLDSEADVEAWLRALPELKERVILGGYASKEELTFEQQFIRVNNRLGEKANSEVFVVDRQYVRPGKAGLRFDLLAVRWPWEGRRQSWKATPMLIEVKYGLTGGVEKLAAQLDGYVDQLLGNWPEFVDELDVMLRQRAELGLFADYSEKLLSPKFKLSSNVKDLEILILLGDLNPHSKRFDPKSLSGLSRRVRVGVMHAGFAVWTKGERVQWHTPCATQEAPRAASSLLKARDVCDFQTHPPMEALGIYRSLTNRDEALRDWSQTSRAGSYALLAHPDRDGILSAALAVIARGPARKYVMANAPKLPDSIKLCRTALQREGAWPVEELLVIDVPASCDERLVEELKQWNAAGVAIWFLDHHQWPTGAFKKLQPYLAEGHFQISEMHEPDPACGRIVAEVFGPIERLGDHGALLLQMIYKPGISMSNPYAIEWYPMIDSARKRFREITFRGVVPDTPPTSSSARTVPTPPSRFFPG